MSFEIHGQVRYSELGPDGRLSLGSLVDYLQDCCAMHSESNGLGPAVWNARGTFWVVTYWRVLIEEYPAFAEPLCVRTWARRYTLTEGDRNLTVSGSDGRIYARVDSRWIFFDRNTQRPCRIPPEEIAAYPVEEPLILEKAPKHIVLPDGARCEEPFSVRRCDLDTNDHVNNGQYVRMAQEYLPAGFDAAELRAEYHRQARLGDMIRPRIHDSGDAVTVSMDTETGDAYCVVQFLRRETP